MSSATRSLQTVASYRPGGFSIRRARAKLRPLSRYGKRPRHPWLAVVDGRAVLGMFFRTRAEAILYAEWMIVSEPIEEGRENEPTSIA
jgi:hypothetical protein